MTENPQSTILYEQIIKNFPLNNTHFTKNPAQTQKHFLPITDEKSNAKFQLKNLS